MHSWYKKYFIIFTGATTPVTGNLRFPRTPPPFYREPTGLQGDYGLQESTVLQGTYGFTWRLRFYREREGAYGGTVERNMNDCRNLRFLARSSLHMGALWAPLYKAGFVQGSAAPVFIFFQWNNRISKKFCYSLRFPVIYSSNMS